MKLIKLTLLLIVVVLNFASCKTTQFRIHTRELRAELSKYSDVLDLARTEIYLKGGSYHFFASNQEHIFLSLYLKPDYNNHEALFAIRDELIDFFYNNRWEIRRGKYSYIPLIAIKFILGETKTYYIAVNALDDGVGFNVYHRNWDLLWYELWYSDPVFERRIKDYYSGREYVTRFGKPIIGKTIHNEKLNAVLSSFEIEQFGGYHASGIYDADFIKIWLVIPGYCDYDDQGDYDLETVREIRDYLINFFRNNQQKLTEEYGTFDFIRINFYMTLVNTRIEPASERLGRVYSMRYRDNRWTEW